MKNNKLFKFSITQILIFLFIILTIVSFCFFKTNNKNSDLPLIAIANYGPHHSLEESITGIKEELENQGFIENKSVRYIVDDVSFSSSLIPQMINKLRNQNPRLMVVMTTPIAQFAKNSIFDIPLIYNVITDPIEAGLQKQQKINDIDQSQRKSQSQYNNITGSSDKQDLELVLKFAKKLMPNAKRIGLLYSTAEINDIALLKMMEVAANKEDMQVFSIPIDEARDVQTRMQLFKDKVDFIYVGTSGPIQPTLPVISAEANKMNIPIINVDEGAVKDGLVLASFGVNYKQVGINAGKLIVKILNGERVEDISPIYPSAEDHYGFINKSMALKFEINTTDIDNNVDNFRVIVLG